jgi:hypothetical protein
MKTETKRSGLEQLAEDLKDYVQKTEESLPTTQNHYGEYMRFLSLFKGSRDIIATALVMAGANRAGVASALRIVGDPQ